VLELCHFFLSFLFNYYDDWLIKLSQVSLFSFQTCQLISKLPSFHHLDKYEVAFSSSSSFLILSSILIPSAFD